MTLKTQLQQVDGLTAILLMYLYGVGACLFFVSESLVLIGLIFWFIGFATLGVYYSRSNYPKIKKTRDE